MTKTMRAHAGWMATALALLAIVAALLIAGASRTGAQEAAYPSAGGLDHFQADDQTIFPSAIVTLPVGYRHQVCLVSDAEIRPTGAVATAAEATGPMWVIAATEGSPTVDGAALVHPNDATATSLGRETCVYWTSSGTGEQTVLLQDGERVLADDTRYTSTAMGTVEAAVALRVRWVDVTAIAITRGGRAVTVPIPQRLTFYGADARGDHFRTTATERVGVSVTPGGLSRVNIAGLPVTFAVTGPCGQVTVPGAVGVGVDRGVIGTGETGSVQWGTSALTVTFANPYCEVAAATTTLTVTAGGAEASVRVRWAWDGYAAVTVTDVGDEGTEKLVTFHAAAPVYRGSRLTGYTCNSQLQSRSVSFAVSGGTSFVEGGLRQTRATLARFTGASIAADAAGPPAQSPGAFALTDSECRQSWTVSSPSRSSAVMLTVTSAGLTETRTLDFTEREAQTGTLGRLDQDIVRGGLTIVVWTFDATPVEDSVGDLDVTAIYFWDREAQRWLSWFPGADGLGVNTLTQLDRDGIYSVVVAR